MPDRDGGGEIGRVRNLESQAAILGGFEPIPNGLDQWRHARFVAGQGRVISGGGGQRVDLEFLVGQGGDVGCCVKIIIGGDLHFRDIEAERAARSLEHIADENVIGLPPLGIQEHQGAVLRQAREAVADDQVEIGPIPSEDGQHCLIVASQCVQLDEAGLRRRVAIPNSVKCRRRAVLKVRRIIRGFGGARRIE